MREFFFEESTNKIQQPQRLANIFLRFPDFQSPNKHKDIPRVSFNKISYVTGTSFQALAGETITNFSSKGSRAHVVPTVSLVLVSVLTLTLMFST